MDYGSDECELLHLAAEEVRLAVGAGEPLPRASPDQVRLAAAWLDKATEEVRVEDEQKGGGGVFWTILWGIIRRQPEAVDYFMFSSPW